MCTGMVKIEASDDSHFMHQTVEFVTLITLIASFLPWACIVDLKNKFLLTGKSHSPWYGENRRV